MYETVEETTERLRTNGYLAHCDEHGNQTFLWKPDTEHAHCPVEGCKAEVCDFRMCFKEGPRHNSAGMVFWHSTVWKR